MLDYESYPNLFITHGNFKIELYEAELLDGEIICNARIFLNSDL